MSKPYTNVYNSDGSFTRIFNEDVDESELVWHRDERDRKITVVSDTGWQIQFDNELPIDINRVTEIHKMVYHRLIKGDGALMIDMEEL